MNPDIVYVVRPGEYNEELRYSLRSLVNLPHGRVWIAGGCPSWVTGVDRIPVPRRIPGHQHAKANLRAACDHPDVSESFVYFNDDFFVMQPMNRIPALHRGSVADVVSRRSMSSSYTRALEKTRRLLVDRGITEPLMYDLHAPMLVTKVGMLEALDLCSGNAQLHERTLFGNLNAIGGELGRNHKVRHRDSGWESWPFLSTADHTFRTLPVGRFIRARFGEQSAFEDAPPPPEMARTPRKRRPPMRYRATQAVAA